MQTKSTPTLQTHIGASNLVLSISKFADCPMRIYMPEAMMVREVRKENWQAA
jgi:hypothetical protein